MWKLRPDFMLKVKSIEKQFGGSDGKASFYNVRDLGSISGLGRSPGEGRGYPLQYPGQFHGLYSPWGCKESDTERLSLSFSLIVNKESEKLYLVAVSK